VVRSWDIGSIAFYFSIAVGIYLNARLAAHSGTGEIDLQRFHSEEGRKYLVAYTILCVITVVTNARLGQSAGASQWPAQNIIIVPMTIDRAWLQFSLAAVRSKSWPSQFKLGLDLVLWRIADVVVGMIAES
jgi:hypothetical protein